MVKYCAKPGQSQNLSWNKIGITNRIATVIESVFLVQILSDLSKLKDQIKKGQV